MGLTQHSYKNGPGVWSLIVIENCEFLGNQDTLFAQSLRQFYKSCRIQGNVDFIFGGSASLFQDCNILLAPRQVDPKKGESNTVTAHGRLDPAQSTVFFFQNCLINGTEEYVKLYHSNPKVHKNFLGNTLTHIPLQISFKEISGFHHPNKREF